MGLTNKSNGTAARCECSSLQVATAVRAWQSSGARRRRFLPLTIEGSLDIMV
jgi:hypothetical protein